MPLRLRTKFTLTSSLLVFAAAMTISGAYVARLTRLAIASAEADANHAASQVLTQAQSALSAAAISGDAPVSSSAQDVRDYLKRVLDQSQGISAEMDAELTQYPAIDEVTIADGGGTALVSSNPDRVDKVLPSYPQLSTLTHLGFFNQLRAIYSGTQRLQDYQSSAAFVIRSSAGQAPFGEVRVNMALSLLKAQITPGLKSAGFVALGAVLLTTLLAGLISRLMLAPLDAINLQLDSYSAEKSDSAGTASSSSGGDEFTQVRTKITRLGEQLRGVREIFSTLRENLQQVMAGLEDGLILFSPEGRAVLVSPAMEKFLGTTFDKLLGHKAAEIFPADHPLRRVLVFEGERLQPLDSAEIELTGTAGSSGPRHVGLTVHAVRDSESAAPETWGALITLRDLESREKIGSELETSERLSALTRITAGVAHEVKNPLNSMRLWLENLKESLPAGHEGSRQAVRVLDSEIERLDRVVKRFLDFTKPVEMRLEDVPLAPLLSRVAELARPQTERSKVTVDLRLATDVPGLRGDSELLRQAVLNLVLNAVEAMPEGGRLTIGLERRGDSAVIMVADTGKGIPPEQRNRIFQLFFTTRKGGSGMGLATTFRIVQLHNGSIDFVTETGRGTAFRIELPLKQGQSVAADAATVGQSTQAQPQ
ncbi:MAG TPA: ATP-binding protein [Candidatus Acidoferrales bacterium]|nr:ATP-binding protein [Candidatus Acidoferrales bacterium]